MMRSRSRSLGTGSKLGLQKWHLHEGSSATCSNFGMDSDSTLVDISTMPEGTTFSDAEDICHAAYIVGHVMPSDATRRLRLRSHFENLHLVTDTLKLELPSHFKDAPIVVGNPHPRG